MSKLPNELYDLCNGPGSAHFTKMQVKVLDSYAFRSKLVISLMRNKHEL